MTITVDMEVVKRHRLGLLTEDVEVERSWTLDVPNAGVLTSVAEIKLGQVAARADHLAEQVRDFADALDQWLVSARATDTVDDHAHRPTPQPHAEPVPKDRDRPPFDPATTMASAPAPGTAS